jgi:tetratricopeptide (TPR) repeat protein
MIVSLVPLALPAFADVSSADGLRLARELRCAEALPLLGEGEQLEVARARALCRLRVGAFAEAASELARLESVDASLATDLGVARFHLGDLAGAEEALRRAQRSGEERAEIPLYLGLVALRRDDAAAAFASFDRAREIAPDADPAASYYSALAQSRRGDAPAARAALERVIAGWPGTPWAEQARQALASLTVRSPVFASLRFGVEHDTNAVLRGEGVILPAEIPSQADQRFVWSALAGSAWAPAQDTQLGAALAFSGSAHVDLTSFDALHPVLALWADRRIGERITLRGAASYGHAWVDERPFLSAPAVAFEVHRDAGSWGASRVFAELTFDDFRFRCPDPDPALCRARDRDGLAARLGFGHQILFPSRGGALAGAIAYRRFTADGTEYSFDALELEVRWEGRLPGGFLVDAAVEYGFRPYRHRSTYELPRRPERVEHTARTELALRRLVWRQLALEARWRYQRNRSTVGVFDYTRHVVGVYASWTRSPP